MRIAQISPLIESVPPQSYGGTERIVSYLTEELVRNGHDVTLFASGDSQTTARLVPGCTRSLRRDPSVTDPLAYHLLQLEHVFQMADQFDLIHSHLDYLAFSMVRRAATPVLTTLHGRLDLPHLVPVFREFKDVPLVSVSNAQRTPLNWVNWQGTVQHGISRNLYKPRAKPGSYLAFLGRISPEKRVDRSIQVSQALSVPLKIAAKVDAMDREYYQQIIKPLIAKSKNVEFIGEIAESEKEEFLGNAYALMFQIDWPEPFGLVMIEAMACGTPVIAQRCGSVPEVIEDGLTGFIVDNEEDALRAVTHVPQLDRSLIRKRFEERFSVERMTQDYVNLYENVLSRNPTLIS